MGAAWPRSGGPTCTEPTWFDAHRQRSHPGQSGAVSLWRAAVHPEVGSGRPRPTRGAGTARLSARLLELARRARLLRSAAQTV